MNIVICDDDKKYRNRLEMLVCGIVIDHRFTSEIMLSTDNPYEVLSYTEKNTQITLYFIDIDLKNKINGLDLAAAIRKEDDISPIVIVTNYSDNIALTYEYKLRIFDFIEKYDFERCAEKIKECIIMSEQRQSIGYNDCINVHNYSANFSVPYENIYFIDTIPGSHKMVIHTQTAMHEFYGKIKDVVNEVDNRFIKCHKSVIVNTHKIIGVDKRAKMIILFGGYQCPYSKRFFNPDMIIDNNHIYML